MSEASLNEALDRAERALMRIERSIERGPMRGGGRDDALRGKVAGILSELDEIIREAGR